MGSLATSNLRATVFGWIEDQGEAGVTVKELREAAQCHHGQASGVLSRLHHKGEIACLEQRRGIYHVYVALDFVKGRTTLPPGGVRTKKNHDEEKYAVFVAGYMAGAGVDKFTVDRAVMREAYEAWLATSKEVALR